MSKKRIIIYLCLIAGFVICVLIKQAEIKFKRDKKIVSTLSEWEEKGRPVIAEKIKRKDIKLYAKLTIKNSLNNTYAAYVPKNTQEKISPGQSVFVKLNEKVVNGKIIDAATELDMDTGMYRVLLKFDEKLPLSQWYIAYVNIKIETNILNIPDEIISMHGKKHFIWVVEDNLAKKRFISIKNKNSHGVIIDEGLNDSDLIITSGYTQLADNTKVNILNNVDNPEDLSWLNSL